MNIEGIDPNEELDELLNGDPGPDLNGEPEPQADQGDEGKDDAKASEPEKGDNEEGSPPSGDANEQKPKQDEHAFDGAATIAERRRRQQAETELAELRAQLARQSQQPNDGAQQDFDPFNPDHFTRAVSTAASRAVADALRNERASRSEAEMMERLGPDKFHETIAEFRYLATQSPELIERMNASADPGKFVENAVERSRTISEIGNDPTAWIAKKEQEIRERLEAENAAKPAPTQQSAPVQQQGKPVLPKTIANAGGSAPSANEMPDMSLEALLGET